MKAWWLGLAAFLTGCLGNATVGSGADLLPATVVCADPEAPSTCQRCDACTLSTPARIRRLTNAELDAAVSALLGAPVALSASLPREFRPSGFSRNESQVVDSAFAQSLDRAAAGLANEAVASRLGTLAPCTSGKQDETCAAGFIDRFAQAAYRRPLASAEREGLLALYRMGAEGSGFGSGIAWVIRGVLQAPSFLYLTELGAPTSTGARRLLTQHEIASSLSFLVVGGPPDAALQEAAEAGTLTDAVVRRRHAQRLLGQPASRRQLELLVLEWLGVDALSGIDKDADLFPGFAELRPHMLTEVRSLVTDTLFARSGSVTELLSRDSSIVPEALSPLYGITGSGLVSMSATPRRGVLSTAAFLATYSTPTESAPVRRGVAVLRRVLCHAIPDPGELNIQVMAPAPSDSLTTRERFEQHTTDASCRGCHGAIDPIGFAFEGFDATGQVRSEENGQAVKTAGSLTVTSAAGPFNGSQDLLMRLAPSPEAHGCFARQAFRFASARKDGRDEEAFLKGWALLPENRRGNPIEVLLAYVESAGFIIRSVEP